MTLASPTAARAQASPDPWLEQVSTDQLPVLPESLAALDALRGRRTLSTRRLATLAAADPSLAVNVLRAAGEAAAAAGPAASSPSPESVPHALLLLGVEPAVRIIGQFPSLEDHPVEDPGRGYLRALARASHAAWLAGAWAKRRAMRNVEGIRVAALACHLGEIAVCARRPAGHGAGHDAGAVGQTAAEAPPTGTETSALARVLAERWGLPELARFCLDPSNAEHPQVTLVVLATRAAAAASQGWYGEEIDRCQSLLAGLLQVEPGASAALLHADTARAARAFARPHELVAARRLMLPPGFGPDDDAAARPDVDRAAPTAPRDASESSASRPNPRIDDPNATPVARAAARQRPDRCLRLLHAHRAGRLPAKEVLKRLVPEMRAALEVERVMLAVVSPDQRILVARYLCPSPAHEARSLAELRVSLDGSHLFARLLQKPQGVWLNRSNRAKLWPLVPPRLQPALSRDAFMAMSLFVNRNAVGLFYADCPSCPERIDASLYQRFKDLCLATGRALGAEPRSRATATETRASRNAR